MSESHLRTVLDELHTELEAAASLDEPARERLRAIAREIDDVLDRTTPPNASADRHSILNRLSEHVGHFEQDHPSLSATLGRLAEALGRTIT